MNSRNRFPQWVWLALVVPGFLVLPSKSASAQSSAALPFYVSDRFQQVALKVVQQVAVEEIKKACPSDQPFCAAMIQNLGEAAGAAFDKDPAKTKVALTQFFVSSSSAALMEATVGDLVRDGAAAEAVVAASAPSAPAASAPSAPAASATPAPEAPGSAPASAADAGKSLKALAKCLSAVVDGKQVADACADALSLVDQVEPLLCKKSSDPCPELFQLKAALQRKRVDGGAIARALRLVARSEGRTDIEMYLASLAAFLDQHPEDGVFEAAYAFLTAPEVDFYDATFLDEDYDRYLLFAPSQVNAKRDLMSALRNCKLDDATAKTWDDPLRVAASYRDSLILGTAADTTPLEKIVALDPKACPGQTDRDGLKSAKSSALTVRGQLGALSAIRHYALAGLLAATAIDFARSGNRPALDEHIRRTLLFALAQLVARARNDALYINETQPGGPKVTALTIVRPIDVLRSCEFQRLALLDHLPVVAYSVSAPKCVSLKGTTPEALSPGATFADLGETTRDDAVAALTEFAYGVEKTHRDDYSQILYAWVTVKLVPTTGANGEKVQSAAAKKLSDILSRIQLSPADAKARADLQKLVAEVANDATLTSGTANIDEKALINEADLGPVLAWTPAQASAMGNIPPKQRGVGLNRQLRLIKEAADRGGPALQLPIPHKLAVEQTPTTEGQRVLMFYQQARAIVDNVAPEAQRKAAEAGIDADLIVKAIAAGVDEQAPVARKLLLEASTEFLREQVVHYTDRLVGADESKCATARDGTWRFILQGFEGACAVKVLIEGAYDPIAEFVWADDFTFTADSASALADKSYRSLIASPALSQTMILFNVGLGINVVTGKSPHAFSADPVHPENSGFVALTLLDKIGIDIAKYQSKRSQFEAGLFVGGFLDALVRTAADSPDKFWLAGATAGWTRVAGYDFGVELHLAAALPFGFHSDPRPALGLALVVPFSYVFE